MKRYIVVIALFALAACAFAIPYASQIEPSATLILKGDGCDISYFVNQAGGTAAIEIIDTSDDSTVATFAGTATQGVNNVSWDGTDNNSGGTEIGAGVYRIKIAVNASAAAGWTQIASNSSVGDYIEEPSLLQTLFDGFSPLEFLISQNPDDDAFGYILVSSAYATPPIYGHVVLNPDLSIPGSYEYMDILDLYIHKALSGEISDKDALNKVAEEWNKVSESLGFDNQKAIWNAQLSVWRELGYVD